MIETAKHVYIDNQNNDLYDFFDKVGFASQFKTEFDKYDVIQRTLKIEANVTDENREKVIDYIKNDFGYVVNYDEHGSENAFELYSPTISKAVGIQKVLEYYNLTKDDTYAFGDGINDLEMIQYCHVGVAMGNAVKELKDVADLICRRIDEDGLARNVDIPVNWCEELGTVLANDEIIDGKSERGGYPVVRKNMKQWVIDIPAYAEKLLAGLEDIDWPESTKEIQRNWIGKSIGAHVDFKVAGHDEKFTVFTTRCDTLFGATYCVLAPRT